MKFIKLFKEISKKDIMIAGGKGASLGEMTQAGIPVPSGYVVLADSFDQFLKITDLNIEIDHQLHSVNIEAMHTVENASAQIQKRIKAAEMPQEIADEIVTSFDELGAEFVAVRSSATSEDSADAAWAGQLDSHMNITRENVVHIVQQCWSSLFTPRAIFYRFEKNLHKENISVAVVIQKMVQSEVSGVAFSVHPVTEDHNQIIIEAGWGFGDAVVSGSITPDSYVVEKEPENILDINVVKQERQLTMKDKGQPQDPEWGENMWTEVPSDKQQQQKLSKKQIVELSNLVQNIEKHYGFPVDIEWALEDGVFYITQSRPITTLSNKQQIQSTKDTYHKVMNRSMTLLDCEVWDQAERIVLPKLCDGCIMYDPVFVYRVQKAVTIYYNFSDPTQDTSRLISYFNNNKKAFDAFQKEFNKERTVTLQLVNSGKADDFSELFESIIKIWPLISISISIGDQSDKDSKINPELLSKSRALRRENDDILHVSTEALIEKAEQKVPEQYRKWIEFLTYSEINSGTLPNFDELEKRSGGYIYHKVVLHTEELLNYAERNNFIVVEEDIDRSGALKDEVKGTIAYQGKVKGRVKIVFERGDIDKVKEGDILVTPMTTPNLMSAMKKASAFVTDEGGVTCHAAIIARELKKPCIIGTKFATEILKDGMEVVVDADEGVVRILK